MSIWNVTEVANQELNKLKVEHNIVHQEIQELEIETEANTTRREAAESIIQIKKKEIDDIEMSKMHTEKSEYKKIQSELHYQRFWMLRLQKYKN